MRFSLVLATVNRTQELKRFLDSLDAQTYRGFELVVVDQNTDGRLRYILESYEGHFPIFHLRSEKGLSRARNVGLEYVTGDIVAFPDDDCWYPPDLLKRVSQFFQEHPDVDGLTGRSIDESEKSSATRWEENGGIIDPFNVWRRSISISIFLKVELINKVGNFDQSIGAGSGTSWGSGEETDYLLRALKAGFRLYYDPSLVVGHPQPVESYDDSAISRGLTYGRGMGYVLAKHSFPLWFVAYQLLRPLGGAFMSLFSFNLSKARYHINVFGGRLSGWLHGIQSNT